MNRFCRRRSAALALCAFWLGSLSLPLQAEPAEAPMLVLDPPSEQALLEARAQTRPWRFALPVAVDIEPSRDGSWAQQGQQQLWQLQLHSPGAQSLSLHFDRWQLPEGARLSLHDAQGRQLDYGPEHGGPEGLWTAMLSGETLWLELRLPLGAPSPEMHLQQVFHGFRAADAALGFVTKAGSCNIDVACAEADGYRDQVRGTLLLQFAGGFSCSGVLINNTAQDFKPLVLTADHCGIDGGNDDSVVAYFNFERERCQTGLSDGNREQVPLDPAQSLSGAEFLAGDRVSDFTLLVLGSRQNPSAIPSAWEPYWVGWTRSLDPADFGASIHHPDADEKSIALFSDPLRPRTVRDEGVDVQTWEVVWSRGTTEPGSSGSGIFGPDGLLRGQLFGGGASCSSPRQPDYYGRFDVSWEGSPFPERHLRSWLDPNGFGANPQSLGGLNWDGSTPGPSPSPAPSQPPRPSNPPDEGDGGSGALSTGWLLLAFLSLRRRRIVATAMLLWSLGASAQESLYVLPPPTQQDLAEAQAQTRPWQFAVPVDVDLDIRRDGAWEAVGEERVWRLDLHSPGAHSLALHFDQWQLPAGAELRLRDLSSGQWVGPYTAERNPGPELWTALLRSDVIRLELRMPRAAAEPTLHVARAFHGFRDAVPTKAGSCNIDVACPEAEPFAEQARATVLVQISGSGSCSGTIVNNTAEDGLPLLLTADHCGIDTRNDQSLVVYFNFQRQSCQTGLSDNQREQDELDPNQSLSGAEFLAGSAETDFTLLVLGSRAQPATIDSAWNPYWAGWTRSDRPPGSGASVHHPSADEKSIALFDRPLQPTSVRDGRIDVQVWEVVWSQGTTEPGSSGSGIFGADGLLRGQLYGGLASCSARNDPDYYGRFDLAWDRSAQASAQLATWLDPVGADPAQLAGRGPGASPAPTANPSPTPEPGATQAPSPSPSPSPTAVPPVNRPTITPAPTLTGASGGGGGSGAAGPAWLLLMVLFMLLPSVRVNTLG